MSLGLGRAGAEADERDVADDGVGDAAAGVAQHGRVAESEAQCCGGVDPGVQARDDDGRECGSVSQLGVGVGLGERVVALDDGQQRVIHVDCLSNGCGETCSRGADYVAVATAWMSRSRPRALVRMLRPFWILPMVKQAVEQLLVTGTLLLPYRADPGGIDVAEGTFSLRSFG